MVEYQRTQTPGIPAEGAPRICIVGVGGAGSNVIDRITLDRIVEATLVCMHTDVRVLSHAALEHVNWRAVHLAIGMPANERLVVLVEIATELGLTLLTSLIHERRVRSLHGARADT